MIRTIITAITGGKREWRVVIQHGFYFRELMDWQLLDSETVIRDRLTYRAACRLAHRLRQQSGGAV